MADLSKEIVVEKILSLSDDLVELLRSKRDANNLTRWLDRASATESSCTSDFEGVECAIRECQKKIDDCKQKTEEARSNVVADEEIDDLQNVLDEEICKERVLQAELREIEKQIDELDQQRISIEERRKNLKKLELDATKARSKLSFYVSVTNIIPNLDSGSNISGYIVKRDKKVADKFEIGSMIADPYDTCNNLWEKMD